MPMTRYERLYTPGRVALAERIAMLALDEEEESGKAILYDTKWSLAKKLGVDEQLINNALRLSYTAEFAAEFGFSFVPPGNGRSGEKYGYVLEHGKSKGAVIEIKDALSDTDVKLGDHLRGSAMHWQMIGVAHGKNTKVGKTAARVAEILNGAAASIERTIEEGGQ